MADFLIPLGAAALLVLLAAKLWTRLGGRPRTRAGALLRAAALAPPAFLLVGWAAWRVSGARGLQLGGEIVPGVETDVPAVALTFDDGPLPGYTDEVLRVLAERNARATFFLVGSEVEAHPAEARAIVAAGHEVGNHTYTHPRMVGKPLGRVREEVERTDVQLRRAGYTGPIAFRPPYGKKLFVLPWYLARAGRPSVTWTVEPDSYPEVAADPGRIVSHVLSSARPGSIVLLHVMSGKRRTSMQAVPGIIDGLRARGYRLVTVSELMELRGS